MTPKADKKQKSKKKSHELEFVLVKWLDAWSGSSHGMSLANLRKDAEDKWLIISTGFLVDERDDYIAITNDWAPDTDGHCDRFRDIHVIPRAYIKEIIVYDKFKCVAME